MPIEEWRTKFSSGTLISVIFVVLNYVLLVIKLNLILLNLLMAYHLAVYLLALRNLLFNNNTTGKLHLSMLYKID